MVYYSQAIRFWQSFIKVLTHSLTHSSHLRIKWSSFRKDKGYFKWHCEKDNSAGKFLLLMTIIMSRHLATLKCLPQPRYPAVWNYYRILTQKPLHISFFLQKPLSNHAAGWKFFFANAGKDNWQHWQMFAPFIPAVINVNNISWIITCTICIHSFHH